MGPRLLASEEFTLEQPVTQPRPCADLGNVALRAFEVMRPVPFCTVLSIGGAPYYCFTSPLAERPQLD